jgi:hypothetical protein
MLNIDNYINTMINMLSNDLIKDIINIIYKDYNLKIIKKQKRLKYILNKDIINFHNIYYYDNKYMIYRNENNQVLLKNLISNQMNNISLYNVSSSNIIINNNHNDNNDIILFDINNDNESLINKKINLNIIYRYDK